jgi:class 3 adenylate cyclase
VNTASRLQELTKVLHARLVVSEQVLRGAGRSAQGWSEHEVAVRGRQQRLKVYARDAVLGA